MRPVAILASGMVTPVGLDSPSSCAAIRCGINPASETRFMADGDWLVGCSVPLDPPLRGSPKLARLASIAIAEVLRQFPAGKPAETPLILLVPEKDRPGRLSGLDRELFESIEDELKIKFHPKSGVISAGRVGIAHALKSAETFLYESRLPQCVIVGTDTYLVGPTLAVYGEGRRLLTGENSNGFIPGEASAAIMVGPGGASKAPELLCLGVGVAQEKATLESEEPLRADGLVAAFRSAMADSSRTFDDVDYRLTDVCGEQYGFKEAVLAIGRAIRKVKPAFDLWHPAESIGQVGAAIGPVALGVALSAARMGYAPGRGVLCHFGNDDGARAALVLRWQDGKAA